jgi:5-methylthioadenosine/S-adenosylhomocysteine deaminase
MQRPHLTPAPDPIAVLAGAARPGDMRHVLINGVFVLRDGLLLTIDRDQAQIEVEARSARLRATFQTPITSPAL